MARDSPLADDLAALAREDLRRLGEPPTGEQLIALRDGKLPEDEAKRIRAWLAADPEWAAIYLDLERDLAPPAGEESTGPVSDADIDEAWRGLSQKLGGDAQAAEVVQIQREPASRALWLLAATVILAIGLVWMLIRIEPTSSGDYHLVEVTGTRYRDARLSVPRGVAGLAFQIDASSRADRVVIEIFDASDHLIRHETFDPGPLVFRVPARDYDVGRTYRLIARPASATGEDPWIEMVWRPVYED